MNLFNISTLIFAEIIVTAFCGIFKINFIGMTIIAILVGILHSAFIGPIF